MPHARERQRGAKPATNENGGSVRRLAIIDDYGKAAFAMADWSRVREVCTIDQIDRPMRDIDDAAATLAPYEIISTLRERTAFPRALLERLPHLRLVCTTGGLHRTLDHDAATARGIVVSGTDDRPGGRRGTPELAFGLMLALARRIPHEDRGIRQGRWQSGVGVTLAYKRLGIVGLGRLGQAVADLGKAFGMDIVAWSPNLTEERAAAAGVQRVDKDELFRTSDFVTLHIVLSDRTRGIVGACEIGLMKPTAYLINTSRGPLIDEAAIVAALREKTIAGAGLDVFWTEPMGAEHPLYACDNAVLTPHLGYVVEDSFRAYYEDTVANILAFVGGAPLRVRNPAVLEKK